MGLPTHTIYVQVNVKFRVISALKIVWPRVKQETAPEQKAEKSFLVFLTSASASPLFYLELHSPMMW